MDWDSPAIDAVITTALAEDIGPGDASVAATVAPGARVEARVVALEEVVCAGLPLVERIFRRLDADISVEVLMGEGQVVALDATLVRMNGKVGAILAGDQSAMNLLSRLSGIATLTREYVERIAKTGAKIRDTRISTPGMRHLEQYAIRMGGGTHHRSGLHDAMVLTRAHIAEAGGIKAALDQAHSHASRMMTAAELTAYEATMPPDKEPSSLPIQIEIKNEAELREALSCGAESILLTELTVREVGELAGVARSLRGECVVELSGDIPLEDALAYAQAGVDFLSPRELTAGARWARMQLLVGGRREKVS